MKTQYQKKQIIFLTAFLLLAFTLFRILQIRKESQQALINATTELSEQTIISHKLQYCNPLSNYIGLLGNIQHVNSIVCYQDNYFVATTGGLIKYSLTGQKLNYYNRLNGLPDNDLTSLATWANKLYIGTKSKGLLVFDGKTFQQYWWSELQPESISSLITNHNKLLIGTFAGGLLEFDGKKFSEIKGNNQKIKAITFIEKLEEKIYVGTFDNGLWIIEPTKTSHVTTTQGLLSNRVIDIAKVDNTLIVATDFGISTASLDQINTFSAFQNSITLPTLASMVRTENRLLLLQDNGQLWQIELTQNLSNKNLELLIDSFTSNARAIKLDNQIWIGSNDGLWRLAKEKLVYFGQKNPDGITDNLISSLAIDGFGRLWVGYFRNGIDIFSPNGHKLTHIENNYLREINHISINQNTILVSTSQGLVTFDSNLKTNHMSKPNRLLSHNVSCSYKISNSDKFLLATSKGLAIGEEDKFSLLTAVHGLPNNNTYSALSLDQSIYVATLTGLAQITNGKVTRVYKDANSTLSNNWITALQVANKELFIGTYGGGVYQLLPNKQLRSFVPEIGRLTVNLNAMFSDNQRLYVGTLTGLWVYQFSSQRWYQIEKELATNNVLSITGNNNNIYVGTTNGITKIEKTFFEKIED